MGLERQDLILYSYNPVLAEREIRYHVLIDSVCRAKVRLLSNCEYCVVGICFCSLRI